MLSGTVAYHLYKARSGLQKYDDFLTKVIILTVATGMLTTSVCHHFPPFKAADPPFTPGLSTLRRSSQYGLTIPILSLPC